MTAFRAEPKKMTDWEHEGAPHDLLSMPRAIAAEVVAIDCPDTLRVIDIGSGAGDFLARFLDRFPEAEGVWSDGYDVAADVARERLERFGDRVSFRIADTLDFTTVPRNLDVIMTSLTVHRLDVRGLHAFYRAAADHLAPGGWLVNLDHVGPTDVWNRRLRQACQRQAPQGSHQEPYHRGYPLTGVDDHLAALAGAGLRDAEMPWRAFVTCLFMARRAD